jgi:hypothetical protein
MKKQTPAMESESPTHSDRVIVDELVIQLIRKELLRSLQVSAGQISAFSTLDNSAINLNGPRTRRTSRRW